MAREDIRTKIRLVESYGYVEYKNRRGYWVKMLHRGANQCLLQYSRAFLRESSVRAVKKMLRDDTKRIDRLLTECAQEIFRALP